MLTICLCISLMPSCRSKLNTKVNLNEISEMTFKPPGQTTSLVLKVEGEVNCACKLTVTMDGKSTNNVIPLSGRVSKKYARDWYGNVLGFKVDPESCAGDRAKVTVILN